MNHHAYHVEPCHPLNPDQRTRMRNAIMDIEIAASPIGNPAGYRIFDAYITTPPPPTTLTATDGYILRPTTTHHLPPPPQPPQPKQRWWRRRRAR